MQLSELIAAAGVAVRQKVGGDENIERVVYDSRAAVPETLFVCIRGFTGDGPRRHSRCRTMQQLSTPMIRAARWRRSAPRFTVSRRGI